MSLRGEKTPSLLRRNSDDEISNFTKRCSKAVEKDSLHPSPVV